jgi:hypothetical protein
MRTNKIRFIPILLAVLSSTAVAAPSLTSPYFTDGQSTYVHDQTSEGINQVNMITCFMAAMKPSALVNEGNYIALIDEKKCDTANRDSAGNSASSNSGSTASQYITAKVNSSRASNSEPMIVKTWVEETEDGTPMTIYVRTAASESPTSSNPYGVFRLDFCGKADAGGPCFFNGFIDAAATGLSFYQTEGGDESRTIAMTLNASGSNSGAGRMSMETSSGGGNSSTDFTFAYNASYFLRSDGSNTQCFSRDATDADTGFSVWRYGLYDANNGERVTRNSGFPIEYTASGTTYHGYMGYWGLWLPGDALSGIATGATVQKVEYGSGSATKTSYTLFKAGGKLTKYTKGAKTLDQIDQIRFNYWASAASGPDGLADYTPGRSYEVYWDNTNARFVISGYQSCGNNGCNMVSISEVATANSYWSTNYPYGLSGWSQALGGEVQIAAGGLANDGSNASSVAVTYRTQDLVYPSQYSSIGNLYCISDCPTAANISSHIQNSSNSPFGNTAGNYSATAADSLVTYTLDANSGNLKDGTSTAVTTSSSLSGSYQWGIRSGKLFPTSQASTVDAQDGSADNSYRAYSVDALDVYYVWETGPNAWNQFSAIKDGSNNFVTFDPPLQLSFTAPNTAAFGAYAGRTVMLQYNGFGDLFGIPGKCVSTVTNETVSCNSSQARYVPEFMIPFNQTTGKATSGSTEYLVKWLDREIRLAKKNTAVCEAAGLSLPSGLSLPTSADLRDPSNASSSFYIGARPTVTSAPRVIHGEVKY